MPRGCGRCPRPRAEPVPVDDAMACRPYPDAVSEYRRERAVAPARALGPPRLVAGAVWGPEALVALGWAAYEVVRAGSGRSEDVGMALALAGLVLAFAVLLGLLSRAWLRGHDWPKTGTVVWNVLLLPVAWSLLHGNALLGVAVGVVAPVGGGAAVAPPTSFGRGRDAQQ